MNQQTYWEFGGGSEVQIAAVLVVAILGAAGWLLDRRHRQPRAGISLVLRLSFAGWIAMSMLDLAMWREQSQPRPGRFVVLVDRTASVDLRDEVRTLVNQAVDGIRTAVGGHSTVEVLEYHGAGSDLSWTNSATSVTRLPGGPTRILRDLKALPATVLHESANVILISDGADPTVARAIGVTAPVREVLLPDDRYLPSDLLLESVDTDAYALVRSPLRIFVQLRRAETGRGHLATVDVQNGPMSLTSTSVLFAPGALTAVATVDVLPTVEGYQVFTVTVRSPEVQLDEQFHRSRVAVRVIRDRIRVLHVVGRPDWETRLLRASLQSDSTIDLVSFQILRTHGDNPGAPEAELSLIPFPTRELFTTELPKFDIVMFQNFDYQPYFHARFRSTLLDNIRDFVVRDGGGFLMSAGDLSFGFGRYHQTPLKQILPVRWSGQGQWRDTGAPVRDGGYQDWFGVAPPSSGGQIDRVYRTTAVADARVIWRSGDDPLAVLGRSGAGRVAAVTTDRLWRAVAMGSGTDRQAVAAFWSRIIRYLSGDPAFEDLHVSWKRRVVAPGEPVQGDVVPGAPETSQPIVIDEGGRTVTGVRVENGVVTFRAPSDSGVVRLNVDGKTAPEPLIVQLPLEERTGFQVDRESWQLWASRQDARIVALEEWQDSGLLERLQDYTRVIVSRDFVSIREFPMYWFFGVLLILADLAVRRIYGAP